MNWIVLCPYGNSMPNSPGWTIPKLIVMLVTMILMISFGAYSMRLLMYGEKIKRRQKIIAVSLLIFVIITTLLNLINIRW